MTVNDIWKLIDRRAPFDTQADFDNSGLLCGDPAASVHTILFALDVTDTVLDEAETLGADLLITHHPLMFSPIQRITEDQYEAHLLRRMIRMGISLIAAHTNLDRASGGINDILAILCGLSNICGEDFIRVGNLPGPVTAEALAQQLSSVLHAPVRLMGDPDHICKILGLCSGGGSGEWEQAYTLGADAFLSGEIKHHHALEMTWHGMVCFECGHFSTEEPGLFALADALQKEEDIVKCNLVIHKSRVGSYHVPAQP